MKKVIFLNLLSVMCLILCACGSRGEQIGNDSIGMIDAVIKEIKIEKEEVSNEESNDEMITTDNLGALAETSIYSTEEVIAPTTEEVPATTTEEVSAPKTEATTEEATTQANPTTEDMVVIEPTTQTTATEEPTTEVLSNDMQNAENYFFNELNYYQEAGNTVTIRPRYVYWEGDKLVAECYVVNSVDRPVYNIDVKSLSFSCDGGNTFFADASFGIMNNATINANSYIVWTFVFSGDAVLSPGENLQTLLCNSSVSYYY